MDDRVLHLARANWRNRNRLFGIRSADRRQHIYIVGQTGTGKTTLLENLMRQDIRAGEGLALLDPHGDLALRVAAYAKAERSGATTVFNPADPACPYRFNPLAGISESRRTVAVASLLEAFQKFWTAAWGPRLEHILRNSLLLLVEQPNATLADIPRLFTDLGFRRSAVLRCTNDQVRRFWEYEFSAYRSDALGPILNKVGAFLADPTVYRIIVSPGEALDLRRIMDEGRVLVVDLAKGRLGGPNSALLGSLILSRIELAALERVDTLEDQRRDFWVYLDEFQNVMTLGLASMLSELRKYRSN